MYVSARTRQTHQTQTETDSDTANITDHELTKTQQTSQKLTLNVTERKKERNCNN